MVVQVVEKLLATVNCWDVSDYFEGQSDHWDNDEITVTIAVDYLDGYQEDQYDEKTYNEDEGNHTELDFKRAILFFSDFSKNDSKGESKQEIREYLNQVPNEIKFVPLFKQFKQ